MRDQVAHRHWPGGERFTVAARMGALWRQHPGAGDGVQGARTRWLGFALAQGVGPSAPPICNTTVLVGGAVQRGVAASGSVGAYVSR